MRELSWKAKHSDNGVFCAPACGRGCTLKEHDRAIKRAVNISKDLRDLGWKPHVWENLGWHYCLKKGENKIHPSGDAFTAFINLGGKQFVADGKTPKKALAEAIRMAKNLVRSINDDLSGFVA